MPGLESFDNLNGFRAQVFDAAVWRTLVQSDMRAFFTRVPEGCKQVHLEFLFDDRAPGLTFVDVDIIAASVMFPEQP